MLCCCCCCCRWCSFQFRLLYGVKRRRTEGIEWMDLMMHIAWCPATILYERTRFGYIGSGWAMLFVCVCTVAAIVQESPNHHQHRPCCVAPRRRRRRQRRGQSWVCVCVCVEMYWRHVQTGLCAHWIGRICRVTNGIHGVGILSRFAFGIFM